MGSTRLRSTRSSSGTAGGVAVAGSATLSFDAWWDNVDGDYSADVIDAGSHVSTDPFLATGGDLCDLAALSPPPKSPLVGAASDGTDIGPLAGPDTWPDGDGDGAVSVIDCDDGAPLVHPHASEVAADGVDNDCDGFELCFGDIDGDGAGDEPVATSADLGLRR